jgi:hypothetical protein
MRRSLAATIAALTALIRFDDQVRDARHLNCKKLYCGHPSGRRLAEFPHSIRRTVLFREAMGALRLIDPIVSENEFNAAYLQLNIADKRAALVES